MSINSSANQHTDDDREQLCWDIYVANLAKGIDNAYQAAIEAKYSEDHSRNITMQGWFKERKDRLRRKDILSKAEQKLEKILNYEPVDVEGKLDVPLLRVQADVSKHVTSTLGKNDGYSTKIEAELSNPDGSLKTIIINKYPKDETNS
jgi:hypothetical protein